MQNGFVAGILREVAKLWAGNAHSGYSGPKNVSPLANPSIE